MSLRRRQPQKSAAGKAMERLTGMLPGGRAAGTSRGGGRAKGKVGLAALAGAAAVAFQNRDRLTALLGRGRSASADGQANPTGR